MLRASGWFGGRSCSPPVPRTQTGYFASNKKTIRPPGYVRSGSLRQLLLEKGTQRGSVERGEDRQLSRIEETGIEGRRLRVPHVNYSNPEETR